jgi:hypothetical protein
VLHFAACIQRMPNVRKDEIILFGACGILRHSLIRNVVCLIPEYPSAGHSSGVNRSNVFINILVQSSSSSTNSKCRMRGSCGLTFG